jgi:hypothetical protein
MRLILILLIAAIAFGVVQGMRHGCKFAFDRATYDCIMGRTAETTPTPAATETPAPAAEPAPAAPAPAQ